MKRSAAYAVTGAIVGLLFTAGIAIAGSNISLVASSFELSEYGTSRDISNPLMFYDNVVTVPASNNVLLISISGGSDVGGPVNATSLFLNCQVDGTNCASSSGSSTAAPAGWTDLNVSQSGNASRDSSVAYTWCTTIGKNRGAKGKAQLQHEVTLSLASRDGLHVVNLEAIHVSIEAAKVKDAANACSGTGFLPLP